MRPGKDADLAVNRADLVKFPAVDPTAFGQNQIAADFGLQVVQNISDFAFPIDRLGSQFF